MSEPILFVGGPIDGQWRCVKNPERGYVVPTMNHPPLAQMYAEGLFAEAPLDLGAFDYSRCRLPGDVYFMAPKHWTVRDITQELLMGYGVPIHTKRLPDWVAPEERR